MSALLLVLLAAGVPSGDDASQTALLERERKALFTAVADGVVFVNCGDASFGSGFFVSPGIIVTNRHVVDCDDKITVILRSGEKKKAKLAVKDGTYDLALLKISVEGLAVRTLPLGNSDLVEVGDYAASVGHPVGGVWTFNEGHISNRYPAQHDQYAGIIQTQVPLQPGSSGGPVFNRRGEVVCVHTAGLKNGGSTGFCIQSNAVRRLVADYEGVANAQLAVNANFGGAEVFVDGRSMGAVPALLTLAPGPHEVAVHAQGKKNARTVTLEKGRISQIFIKSEELK